MNLAAQALWPAANETSELESLRLALEAWRRVLRSRGIGYNSPKYGVLLTRHGAVLRCAQEGIDHD